MPKSSRDLELEDYAKIRGHYRTDINHFNITVGQVDDTVIMECLV